MERTFYPGSEGEQMNGYTTWLDDQIKTAQSEFVDQAVDQNYFFEAI